MARITDGGCGWLVILAACTGGTAQSQDPRDVELTSEPSRTEYVERVAGGKRDATLGEHLDVGAGGAPVAVGVPFRAVSSDQGSADAGGSHVVLFRHEDWGGALPAARISADTLGLGAQFAFVGDLTGSGSDMLAMMMVEGGTVGLVAPETVSGELALEPTLTDFEGEYPFAPFARCGDVTGDGQVDLCLAGANYAGVFAGPILPGASVPQWSYLAGPLMIDARLVGDERALYLARQGFNEVRPLPTSALPNPDLDALTTWRGPDPSGAGSEVCTGDLLTTPGLEAVVTGPLTEGRRGRGWVLPVDAPSGELEAIAHTSIDADDDVWWLGHDCAVADLDGDGQDDLILGAPGDLYFHPSGPGEVWIFRGPLDAGRLTRADADQIWIGPQDEGQFGHAVSVADLDADGVPELIVGAPFAWVEHEFEGLVYRITDPLGVVE